MKTRHSIICVIVTFWVIPVLAQQRLSLDSVLARVSLNPALQAYDARINAQNQYAEGAKNLDAPKVSAGQYQTPYQFSPDAGSFMITAEQMFTNPAKLKAKENYMKGLSQVTAEEKNYTKNQLIAQAKGYYFDRVILERKLTLLQNTRNLLEYMLKDANIRLTYGKEKLNNIYKAKADLFTLDNSREEMTNEISQKNIMLNTLMNRDKQTAFSVDTNVMIKDYELAKTDTSALVSTRSDIRGIASSVNLQMLNAQMEWSKRKPDFGIQAGHMFSYGGMANQYVLMGSITIPIVPWASKEYKANLKGIHYDVEELQQKKADVINQAAGQLESLKAGMRSKKRQLKNYQGNIIPALQNNYKTALLAYEQNTGDMQVVLDGLNALQMARMESLNRLQELLQLQVVYEKENEKY